VLSKRQFFLLAILTVFWGLNWPVLKIGVRELPPVFFRLLCVVGGVILTGLYARVAGISLAVPARGWKRLFGLALPNLILWYLLGTYAISMIPSGRAAILGYTMPIWAALIGVVCFRERLDGRTWFGVLCALFGVVLLLAGEWQTLSGRPLGAGLMLLAAMSWGAGTHMMRRTRLDMNTTAISFWMLVMASVALALFSLAFEFDAWRMPVGTEWLPIAYNAIFVLGLCNIVWFSLVRSLPPVASGLSGMLIPVVGVFSSMVMLGEKPHWRDDIALVLILVSLATVMLRPRPPAQQKI